MALSITGQRQPKSTQYRVVACSTAPVALTADFAAAGSLINQREFSGKQLGAVAIREGGSGELNGMIALGDLTTSGWAPMTAGTPITPATVDPLAIDTDLSATDSVATGAAISLAITAQDGHAPYTYAWYKDGVLVAGQTGATFTKAAAVAGDAGVYKCVVTDAAGDTVESTECTLTVS